MTDYTPQTADLVEWKTNSYLGWWVRAISKAGMDHTSGVIIKYGEVRLIEAIGSKVIYSLLKARMRDYPGQVFLVKLKPEYDDRRGDIAYELEKLESRPYGFTDLIRMLYGQKVKVNARQVICSEAIQVALIKAGLLPADYNNGKILWPGEFTKTGLYLEPWRIL